MPAIKKRTSSFYQYRDFWGDETLGQQFDKLIDLKYGTFFGARKTVIADLKITRRLLNMYISGERAIPDDVWAHIEARKDFIVDARNKTKMPNTMMVRTPMGKHRVKAPVRGRSHAPRALYVDDNIDPLS